MTLFYTSLLACVQNVTLDYECQNISEVTVKLLSGCRLQFVPPEQYHEKLCVHLLATDIRQLDQEIVASGLRDVSIEVKLRSLSPILNISEINVFRFSERESVSMQNVTLRLDISDTQDVDGSFLQAYNFEKESKEELNALVLKRFKIDAGDKCKYTVQDFVPLNGQESVVFKDENLNGSSICLDLGSVGLNRTTYLSVFTPRPAYENIRILGSVTIPDQTFSALSNSQWAGSTVVERCFFQLNVTGFVFAGLFSVSSNPLKLQKTFLRSRTTGQHAYGLVKTAGAPVFIDTGMILLEMEASAQAAFMIGKSRSSLVVEQTNVQVSVEAPVFAAVLAMRFIHLQHCAIILEKALGDGGLILFDTRLFDPSHVLAADCQFEAKNVEGKVALVYRLRRGSALELTGVKGGGCPVIINGGGDVFGEWIQ